MVTGECFYGEGLAHSIGERGCLHFGFVGTLIVSHPINNPESSIDGVSVVDHLKLLTMLLIPGSSLLVGSFESPVESHLVDLGAPVTNFIVLVEVSIGLTRSNSQSLSRLQLYFHVPSSTLESIQFVEIIVANIVVFGDRICFDEARFRFKCARSIDNWVMYWYNCSGAVELVIVDQFHILILEMFVVCHHIMSKF